MFVDRIAPPHIKDTCISWSDQGPEIYKVSQGEPFDLDKLKEDLNNCFKTLDKQTYHDRLNSYYYRYWRAKFYDVCKWINVVSYEIKNEEKGLTMSKFKVGDIIERVNNDWTNGWKGIVFRDIEHGLTVMDYNNNPYYFEEGVEDFFRVVPIDYIEKFKKVVDTHYYTELDPSNDWSGGYNRSMERIAKDVFGLKIVYIPEEIIPARIEFEPKD